MPGRIVQDRRDYPALVGRGRRRMPPVADRQAQDALFHEERQLPGIEQPFQEVGRAQVRDGESRPVQHLLGNEMVPAGMALGMPVGRALGQVDHMRDTGLLRCLREIDRRMDQPRLHRPHHVGGIDAIHRGDDRVDLQEIAHSDPGALLLSAAERASSRWTRARTFRPSAIDSSDRGPAGVAGDTRDQYGSGGGRSWHAVSMQCAVPLRRST